MKRIESKRLRFSIWVIVANFIIGIIGMILGADLTALGVFLSLSNAPLYVYVIGDTIRPTILPDSAFSKGGNSGGLGTILNHNDTNTPTPAENPVQTIKTKPVGELG